MCNGGYYLTALYWKMLKNTLSLLRTTICLSGHAFFVRIATNISKNFKQLKSKLCSSIRSPGINWNKNYFLNPISKSIKTSLLRIKFAFPSLKAALSNILEILLWLCPDLDLSQTFLPANKYQPQNLPSWSWHHQATGTLFNCNISKAFFYF